MIFGAVEAARPRRQRASLLKDPNSPTRMTSTRGQDSGRCFCRAILIAPWTVTPKKITTAIHRLSSVAVNVFPVSQEVAPSNMATRPQ